MGAQPNASASRIESEVRRIRALLEQQQFAAARTAAESVLVEAPKHRDALYLLAVSQRYLGLVADALRTLLRLECEHPDYGRLFQERGHCYRAVAEQGPALAAYQQAVFLNPTLRSSWQALEELHRTAGELPQADTAARHLQRLASLPSPLRSASELLYEGDLHGAERSARAFVVTHPEELDALRVLAQIAGKLGACEDAQLLWERLLARAPGDHAARYEYAVLLSSMHDPARALDESRRLLQAEPDRRIYRAAYACACAGLGKHAEALRVYQALAAETPDRAELQLSLGHVLKDLGKRPAAVEAYRRAANLRRGYGEAYWSLANLKTYRFDDEETALMQQLLASPSARRVDRYQVCFALGKALEDRAQYGEAFAVYERGNALKRSETRYRAADTERNARLQQAVCTPQFFAARKGVGCARADPIFIVGLPRSGSTLLEQILASHSKVDGTMELADVTRLVNRLQGGAHDVTQPRYPGILAQLSADELRGYGETYLKDTQAFRTDKPYFVDKMPNNFRHIGLIHLMLPNAKIIDARREAMACCFSNFKQLFAAGHEFSYSLEDIGRYYRSYLELMSHWDSVLPQKILRVQYEDVVADLPRVVRQILEYCGLEFEQNCVEFYNNERSVHTASSEQVRRPIFRDNLEQWRPFEPWLGSLKTHLRRD
jgi:tetratricopeptide (TPR) repeat protein